MGLRTVGTRSFPIPIEEDLLIRRVWDFTKETVGVSIPAVRANFPVQRALPFADQRFGEFEVSTLDDSTTPPHPVDERVKFTFGNRAGSILAQESRQKEGVWPIIAFPALFLPSGTRVAKRRGNGLKNMKCAETTLIERPAEAPPRTRKTESPESVISIPMGLLGFEQVKHYTLLASAEEAPFLWLQMVEDPNLAFLVVAPSVVVAGYQPDISEEEVAYLELADAKDALVFNIVTIHPDGKATVNLKGPIVVNRRTLIGKQVVPLNAANFSLQHPVTADDAV
jgi:flagellar assembly factor FliW